VIKELLVIKHIAFIVCLLIIALYGAHLYADKSVSNVIYLDCVIPDDTGKRLFHITLDESTQSVSYIIPEFNVQKTFKCIFTPDKVVFNSFEINRVDLSITRTIKIVDDIRVDKGTCTMLQAPSGRKF
jgi:hypothetical protein